MTIPHCFADCGHLHRAGYNISGTHMLYRDADTPFLVSVTQVSKYSQNSDTYRQHLLLLQRLHTYNYAIVT
jgi:hypothetical protein